MSILGTRTSAATNGGTPSVAVDNLLTVPTQILDPWLGKIQTGSVVAALSGQTPQKFGSGQAFTFDIGEAEFVGENQPKGPSAFTQTVMTIEPRKVHKTIRVSEEVLWADEDHQLGVVAELLALIQPALSRALDFGVLHAINPATGGALVGVQSLSQVTKEVAAGDADGYVGPFSDLDDADALVLADGYIPSDVALSPAYAASFGAWRNPTTFQKAYPDFRLSTEVSSLEGHRASVSRTVDGVGVVEDDTGVAAYVGDFSAIRWGVQKAIGLELIRYGDPDGQGDLKRHNQVAFRAEVVYGWGIADLDAFARITATEGS